MLKPNERNGVFDFLCNEFIPLWPNKGHAWRHWNEIVEAYSAPERHYHDLSHLSDILLEPEARKASTQVKLAVFYHDLVMSFGKSHDDERRSSEVFIEHAHAHGIFDLDITAKPRRMIEKTAMHGKHGKQLDYQDDDTHLFLDLDLAILGKQPDVYQQYENEIRTEYQAFDDKTFWAARGNFMVNFLKLDQIYHTPSIASRYEKQARINIESTILKSESA